MNSIFKWILSKINPDVWMDYLAGLVVNFLPGLKTKGLSIIGMIIGVYNLIATPENIKKLCDAGIVCLEGNPIWGKVLLVFSFLAMVFRKATDQSMAQKGS
jgi:hypothetical protein